jgi:murein DD-endopeptidase MepM/ murein hydrolase activator NlpD
MNALEQINSLIAQNANKPGGRMNPQAQEALQKAAKQFEAILLMQLTSALNGSKDENDGEDSLFGSDGGTSMAKQMFSEQMATTMSENGGVGLADLIMQKFGGNPVKNMSTKTDGLAKMMSAVKDIRDQIKPLRNSESNIKPLINRSGRIAPLPVEQMLGNPNDAMVVSTDAQMYGSEKFNAGTSPFMAPLDPVDAPANATRARRVSDAAAARPTNYYDAVPGSGNISYNREIRTAETSSTSVDFNLPVRGRVSSSFGERYHPIDKVKKFHAGMDIAVPSGTRVDTTAEGEVSFAGWSGGYGNLVVIKHPDGKESRYGHLEKVLVTEGEKVKSGQQIALSGSTGKSTGPHLHFEIRENGKVLNPMQVISNVSPKSADR